MTKSWMKFLLKLDSKKRFKMRVIIEKILKNDFEGLEVQVLLWKQNFYKIRVWKIRVIFIKSDDENIIEDIWYRWDIYKWL
jgi:mRNA-degrading endonuclease RelE of RelBE toxin-antitoxin system